MTPFLGPEKGGGQFSKQRAATYLEFDFDILGFNMHMTGSHVSRSKPWQESLAARRSKMSLSPDSSGTKPIRMGFFHSLLTFIHPGSSWLRAVEQ